MTSHKRSKARRIERETAATYALWFEALSDPSRILILNELARAPGPLTVGELVRSLDIGQSTVSHHLARLAEVRFVVLERAGTTTRVHMNKTCLTAFPSAAGAVMGLLSKTELKKSS